MVAGTAETDEITGGVESAVVNDQVTGAVMGLPASSCEPLTVAVYTVLPASGAFGVSTERWLATLYVTVAGTTVLAGSVNVNVTVAGCTGSL